MKDKDVCILIKKDIPLAGLPKGENITAFQ